MEKTLPDITPKGSTNYVAFFLTLACNLSCPYCINLHGGGLRRGQATRTHLTADEWIMAANRLILRDDLPLTLQGGEPTLDKGFFRLAREAREDIKMDLMTNLTFDVAKFIKNVPLWRFTREAPYAAIRASYHPGQSDIEDLIEKTMTLQDAGFRVGLYGVEHPNPEVRQHIRAVQEKCLKLGLDFRTKEFLGEHDGRLYGTFRYSDCVGATTLQECECRTTEIIVDPGGNVYRCHADLYHGREYIAHILDADFTERSLEQFRSCEHFGDCNPCDVKVKTNRFQIFGHTSVEIMNICDRKIPMRQCVTS